MSTLTDTRIADLVAPYLDDFAVADSLYAKLSVYLDLLLKWNARINLTAIRDPEEIVRRHFGESLFTGTKLAARTGVQSTLLDFGSGAGFPGLPIQLLLPHLRITLAESQNKKASFLQEAARTLQLPAQIHAARVEALPLAQTFDVVTLRAVDNMQAALAAARPRVAPGGWLATLTASVESDALVFPLPNADTTFLQLQQL